MEEHPAILSKGEKEWIKLWLNWSVFLGNTWKFVFQKDTLASKRKEGYNNLY